MSNYYNIILYKIRIVKLAFKRNNRLFIIWYNIYISTFINYTSIKKIKISKANTNVAMAKQYIKIMNINDKSSNSIVILIEFLL